MLAIEVRVRPWSGWAPKLVESSHDVLAVAFNWRYLAGRLSWFVVISSLLIETLLTVRLWAQLTGRPVNAGLLGRVFDATTFLVSPFQEMEPTQPIKTTGVLEFATLLAMEAYLVAAVSAILILLVVPRLVRFTVWLALVPIGGQDKEAAGVSRAAEGAS